MAQPPARHPRGVLAHRATAVASVASGGLAQVGPPIAALLLLGAREFGAFSLLYLVFAWGLSLQLSICTEPYARHRLAHGHSDTQHRHMRAASTALATATALVVAVLAAVLWGSWQLTVLSSLAVLGTVVRNGARFQVVVERGLGAALRGDIAYVLGFAVGLTVLLPRSDNLTAVLAAWALAGAATMMADSRPFLPRPSGLRQWATDHRAVIWPLLRESLVLDASSIGGAYVLVPVLTLTDFGVYRAVSNVATPVRLAAEALRPMAGRRVSHRVERMLMLALVGAGLVAAIAAGLALLAVDRFDVELGVVSDLVPYAVPTAVFVGASLVGAVLYYRARIHATAAELWRARLWQSGTAAVIPLAGALVTGLDGAIAGTALATVLGAAVWWPLAQAGHPGGR